MNDDRKVVRLPGHMIIFVGNHHSPESDLAIAIEATSHEERQLAALSVLAEEVNPASGTNTKNKRRRPRDRQRDRRSR